MIYIDAHNLIKRIYHGGGNPYTLFYNLMIKYQDKTVAIVCDGPHSRDHRKAIHPGYKAGRNQGDDPVYWEVYNNCQDIALEFANTRLILMDDGEADDFIADRATVGSTVISNDKDLWPLIDKKVNILLNASTKVDEQLVETKFNSTPGHIYLYKALVGDPSDKIPGKRGFGPAAWTRLNFEDRELYKHHFSIGNCRYDSDGLMTEQACMSWKLAVPYLDYKFRRMPGKPDGNPLELIEKKGIVL